MIVIASKNGAVGIETAVDVLKNGGSALDAVEAGIRLVEANPDDHTVGYGGYPNLIGEVELDASIMNGRTLESGAVGAMKEYPYAISVARKVMETLPHVMLVGDGAQHFAAEMGFQKQDLLTSDARTIWENRLRQDMPQQVFENLGQQKELRKWVRLATDPERAKGTVNFIAQDTQGNIASGVSTSGWAWKYPGRIGDSPIIGAGNYADNRYGAAACTGMGEMAIRGVTAHSVTFYLKMGLSIQEAGERAMTDLKDLDGRYRGMMRLIALDKDGNHAGFSSGEGHTYIFQTGDMVGYEEVARTTVALPYRWA
ncbi:MAG: N(4)-(beta-N-acetylglucosaminyl)-L-asparaginase [Candidatus Promineifilaceae bacterium]|nr:N(4)-(beta-N-acetylglucosaminyl)-L-asparaginase [Candidatus Promineifilaceae bacterium]